VLGSDVNPDIETVGALRDRQRRAVYAYVSQQRHDVSRDEAAETIAISRSLASFHLDRLVRAGLLEVTYRRLTGRQGPGAGRPSKLYRRGKRQIGISLPERRYELLARLLAAPLYRTRDHRIKTRLADAARTLGQQLAATPQSGRLPSARGSLRAIFEVLEGLGVEPYTEGRMVRLRNCPFDTVAASYPELVCGTNLHLIEGVIEGLGVDGVKARLDPRSGECCVALTPVASKGGRNA
jgi:predicted ArsR family transcriptional regulator